MNRWRNSILLAGGLAAAAGAWSCSRYQPSRAGYVGAAPEPGATAESIPAPPAPSAPRESAAAQGALPPDLPVNPAVWGERAERAVGRRFDPIYFDFDSAELRPQARRALENYAGWLRQNPGVWVTLEGHCDTAGSNEYNYNLGMRRAVEAKIHLALLGTEEGRIFVISYGEERLAVAETTTEEAQLNRRVEVRAFRAPSESAVPPTPAPAGAAPEPKDPAATRPSASDLP